VTINQILLILDVFKSSPPPEKKLGDTSENKQPRMSDIFGGNVL
jgi:hypothetical protein